MLKKRVIPVLLLRDGRMVKGVQFANYRDTGNPKTAVRIYSAQDADELVFLDIASSRYSKKKLIDIVREAATECFMPLAAGGGIESIDDVRQLLLAGADKIVVTTAAVTNPSLISEIAERFGSQCVVAGIDYRHGENGARVWIRCGTEATGIDPVDHARHLVALGAGEIFLNSIDQDGVMQGYDLEIAALIASAVPVPVIVCGGAGNFMHLVSLLKNTAASAAACASIFHFGDNNPIRARSYLRNLDIPMRMLK
ncbi:MAG: imidazole glycerol phosphate synthase cyclase subunit [Polaromonas sp.]|uniref:imidazole glycerol phosphate synthase subunit HisF n=1 Tax=Polaromonas sp. TaxID=1869339 RepID=UPI002735EF56|nr:imidazole glycerol phosphate synthase cyclase subunit [Polaromonas sp.]MDP2820547.1 imidazole glycerol phosphate synthase cyclase subunit [Polaromonas sp.]